MPPAGSTPKPIADGIPLEKAWRFGRRIYVRCGYNSPLNQQLRDIGARWDNDARALWVGSGKLDQVLPLVQANVDRINEVEQVKARGLWVTIPYEAADIRKAAKDAGGVYDGDTKRWALPDETAHATIAGQVRAYNQRVEEQRAAERAELDRLAQLDREQRAVAAQQAAQQREAGVVEQSGRIVTGDRGVMSGQLYGRMRRPEAEQAKPQPGEVRKLGDGRRVLVLSSTVTFYSQDAVDDDFAPGGTGSDPGWYYRYEFVPVEANTEERAADDAESAELADHAEIAAVLTAADKLASGKVVDQMTHRPGQIITRDAAGGMTVHGGQIVLTSAGECWYEHPGYYDDYIRREVQIVDDSLIARVRAILEGGDRRRGQYQVSAGTQ